MAKKENNPSYAFALYLKHHPEAGEILQNSTQLHEAEKEEIAVISISFPIATPTGTISQTLFDDQIQALEEYLKENSRKNSSYNPYYLLFRNYRFANEQHDIIQQLITDLKFASTKELGNMAIEKAINKCAGLIFYEQAKRDAVNPDDLFNSLLTGNLKFRFGDLGKQSYTLLFEIKQCIKDNEITGKVPFSVTK